jgi:hypothetical protein
LARIALCKVIKKKIDNIKCDPAIINWKNTFIQYRSRFEKRKCWKEKQKSILSIEKSLIVENGLEIEMDIEQTEEKTSPETSLVTEQEVAPDETLEENVELVNEPLSASKIEKTVEKVKQRKVATKKEPKASLKSKEEKILKVVSLEEEEEEEADLVPENKPVRPAEVKKKMATDIFVEKRPSYMVVQQFNLDESKNSEEIILGTSTLDSKDEELVIKEKNENQIINDPFFLDKNGNEIIDKYEDDHYRDSYSRDFRSTNRYDNSRDFSSANRYDNSRDFSGANRYDNSRSFSRNSENIDKRGDYNRNQSRENSSFNRSSDKSNFTSNRPSYNNRFDDKLNFSRPKTRNHSEFNSQSSLKKSDVSHLHPSWQAKKEMEEKAKVKFEGKKKTFSDD